MKKLLLIASLLLVVTTSCFKTRDRMVTGQIVDSTNNQAIANTDFELIVTESQGWMHGFSHTYYTFTTNDDGNFIVNFSAKDYSEIGISKSNTHSYDQKYIWGTELSNDHDYNTGTIYTTQP